jgi:hypothetical protein
LDFVAASLLNHKIAQNCITKLKDANNTAVVSNAIKGTLAKLSIYKNTDNTFFKTLESLYLRQNLPLK